MIIETKFNNGDKVWWAYTNYGPISQVDCAECGGAGSLTIEGKAYKMACPNRCSYGKVSTYGPMPLAKQMTVGQVRVEISDSPGEAGYSCYSNYGPQRKRVEQYMCVESGIGSGSLYYVEDLFETEQEALERGKVKVIEALEYQREEESRRQKEREYSARQLVQEEEAALS